MYRERLFLRLCRHTRIMGRQHQRSETVGENQQWQKEIVIHWERLFRKITQLLQHGWQHSRTEFSSLRTCFHKTFIYPTQIHGRVAIAKPSITENSAQMLKRWCHDHKTWTSDDWNSTRGMVRWVVLHAILYIRKNLYLENIQGSLQSGMPASNSETQGRSCDGLGSSIMVFCWP
jgi:hypothetical protein